MKCPYCPGRMGPASLRVHVALNSCGGCPAGACLAYDPDEALATSEDEYRKMAEQVARSSGWLVCHVERARAGADGRWHTPATPGFPDSWFVHPDRGRLLVVEFKSEKGRTNPKLRELQSAWLEAVAGVAGATAMRSRPSGWRLLQAKLNPV